MIASWLSARFPMASDRKILRVVAAVAVVWYVAAYYKSIGPRCLFGEDLNAPAPTEQLWWRTVFAPIHALDRAVIRPRHWEHIERMQAEDRVIIERHERERMARQANE